MPDHFLNTFIYVIIQSIMDSIKILCAFKLRQEYITLSALSTYIHIFCYQCYVFVMPAASYNTHTVHVNISFISIN